MGIEYGSPEFGPDPATRPAKAEYNADLEPLLFMASLAFVQPQPDPTSEGFQVQEWRPGIRETVTLRTPHDAGRLQHPTGVMQLEVRVERAAPEQRVQRTGAYIIAFDADTEAVNHELSGVYVHDDPGLYVASGIDMLTGDRPQGESQGLTRPLYGVDCRHLSRLFYSLQEF